MPEAKPISQILDEAMDFSMRLETRRGQLTDFEVQRLERLAMPVQGNMLLWVVKELLVSEIERDFERFDNALKRFLQANPPVELVINIVIQTQFAFNSLAVSDLIKWCFNAFPDSSDLIEPLLMPAWFVGDLELCIEMCERLEKLKFDRPVDKRLYQVQSILSSAGIELSLYRNLFQCIHGQLRAHLKHKRDVNVALDIDTDTHEDGSESIVIQIFSDLEGSLLDQLDEEMLDIISDTEKWGIDLPRLVTILVRDMVPFSSVEECERA